LQAERVIADAARFAIENGANICIPQLLQDSSIVRAYLTSDSSQAFGSYLFFSEFREQRCDQLPEILNVAGASGGARLRARSFESCDDILIKRPWKYLLTIRGEQLAQGRNLAPLERLHPA
jgi:hypothetical protein